MLAGEPKLPHERIALRREVEHWLQLLRSLLELVAPDQRQCRDDADRRDAGADDEGAGEPMHERRRQRGSMRERMRGPRRRDRRQDGDAERTADLLCRVEETG